MSYLARLKARVADDGLRKVPGELPSKLPEHSPGSSSVCFGGTLPKRFPENCENDQHPTDWILGFQQLLKMPSPAGVDLPRWRLFLGDAAAFLAQWGAEAAGKGWHALDLFGMSNTAPAARADLAGLCWHLNGRTIVVLSAEAASIGTARGSVQRFFRRKRGPGQVLAWELKTENDPPL